MAQLSIRKSLWNDFVALARRLRRNPDPLAERALNDYVQRIADDELLADSADDARRGGFRIEDTEDVIQIHRTKAVRRRRERSR